MKQCPKCQANISDTAKFCMECGFNIKKYEEEQAKPKARFCPECGTEIPRGSFCPECGYNIGKEQSSEVVSPMTDTFDDAWLSDLEKDIGAEVERMKEQKNEAPKEKDPVTIEDEEYIRKNFVIKDGLLKKYIGNEKEVTIPSFVTTISIRAFANCQHITSIVIPNTVTKIMQAAFTDCFNLTNVVISDSVKSIPTYAFADCKKLNSVVIPDSVKKIGDMSFDGCEKLVSITLPNHTKYEPKAFPKHTKIIRK